MSRAASEQPVRRSAAWGARTVLGVALLAAAVALLAGPGSAAARGRGRGRLTISPADHTPDASPRTQISILGVSVHRIRSVTVSGSLSGMHPGQLRAYSRGRGASFLLRRPLTPGERVVARVRLDGGHAVSVDFTVADLAPLPPVLPLTALQPTKLDSFLSDPGLTPPVITPPRRIRRGLSPGDIFLAPLPSPTVHPESDNELTIHPVGPGGPMIVARSGQLVWFDQLAAPDVATDFRPQRWLGRRVLTWWQGPVTIAAFGLGEGVIADTSYRTIRTVRTGNGYGTDLHEFTLTPSGDALFTIYSPVLVHLPGTPPGTRSPLLDAIIQEVDVRTGLVVWEWHALGHIPLRDSYATAATSADLDAFHINAIQVLAHGRLLVSARDTSAIYELDQRSGRILWTLGGKASSFRLGPGARFWFQHDGELLGPGLVGMFDDEAGPPDRAASSRGLILKLDPRRRTATVWQQFRLRAPGALADSEGSLQWLPDGHVFVGFGAARYVAEFSAGGRLLYRAALPVGDGSYRAYLYPWHATPRGARPAAAAQRIGQDQVAVEASWNGATAVDRWQVLAAGAGGGRLAAVAVARRAGFETRIVLRTRAGRVQVRALDRRGRPLGSSSVVAVSRPAAAVPRLQPQRRAADRAAE